jgi:thiaminase
MFNEHAAGAIAVSARSTSFFAHFGLSEEDVARTPMAPTNLAYTSYLIATAYGGSFSELLGAVLLLLDLLGGRQGTARERIAGSSLWALDRDLRR